jgi:NADP-dependent 3-hydroxy acid dehydrogenase YdfG
VSTLAGRTALITGGSRGIGLEVARLLAAQDVKVVLLARDRERLQRTAQQLGVQWHAADITVASALSQLREALQAQLGGTPDIVVNSAGAFELASIVHTSVESFDRQMAVNLRAVFLLAHTFLPGMLERRSGHFVTIGSVAGRHAFAANGAYAASKFGVRGLHDVLQVELKGTGVRATLIEPAATNTELWQTIDRTQHTQLPQPEEMLSPEVVAGAVLYALSQPDDTVVSNVLVQRG